MKKTGQKKEAATAGTGTAREKVVSPASVHAKRNNHVLKKSTAKKIVLPGQAAKKNQKAFTTDILGSFGICMWEFDICVNKLFYANEAYKLLGLKKNSQVTIEKMPGLFSKTSAALLKQAIHTAIEKGKSFDLELMLTSPKEKTSWVRVTCKPVRTGQKITALVGSFQNISKQKNSEVDLLINNTEESFVLVDKSLKIVTFNAEFKNSYKKFLGREVQKGDSILNYAQPERKKIARRIYKDVLAGQSAESEIEIVTTTGTKAVFFIKYKPARDESGNIIGVFVTTRNITEQKKSQQLLIDSEKRFKALVENGSDAIAILSATGKISYVTPSIKKILGYTEKEISEIDLFSLLHPEDAPAVQKVFENALASPGISMSAYTARVKHKNGSWRWLEATVTNMLHDPTIRGVIDNFRDVTENIETERKIKEERGLFRTLIDNLPINVYTKDLHSKKTLANRVDYEYSGFSSEKEVLGKTDLDLFAEESAKNTIEEDKLIFKTGKGIIGKEEHHKKKDGSDIWFLISKIPLKDEEGKITGLLGISFDISQRKEAEKEIFLLSRFPEENPNPVIRISKKGKILYHNKASIALLDHWQNKNSNILKKGPLQMILKGLEAKNLFRSEVELKDSVYSISCTSIPDADYINIYALDISETKKAEAKLAKKDEQLSLATQIARLGYWEEDLVNKTESWSDETYRIFGYEPGEIKASRDTFLSIVHPEDLEEVKEIIENPSKGLQPIPFTNRIVRKDGSVRVIYTEGRFVFNKQRKIQAMYGIHHDITEQKKAEEALKESKLSLEKAFDIARIGSWKYDIINDRYEWTQSAIDVIGFDKDNIPLNWEDFKSMIPAEEIEDLLLKIKKSEESGVIDSEHRIIVNGNSKWVRVKSHLEYDSKGNPVISTGIIQDINERKLIEKQLQDASHFNQTIIESSPVGIWIYDETGQAVSVNRAAIELSGSQEEVLLTMNFKHIPVWKKSGLYEAAIESLNSGSTIKKEIHIVNSFGKEVWFDALLTPVKFKGKKQLILMTYDIKERMMAEELLVKSEKQLSLAMRIARLGYWEFDVREGLFTFNDQFFSMLKTTAEKAGGYKLSPQHYAEMFVYPDDQPLVGIEVEKALTSADPNFSSYLEHRVIFGNGEVGYISVNFYIVKDAQGNTIRTYGVNQDITERKKAEEEIRLAKERYELVARVTNDAIYEWDIVNNFNYWGEGFETLFGHKRTGDKMPVDTWADNLHPDEKDQLFATAYEAFKNKTPSLTRELRFKCADGNYKTVFDKLVILYNKEGKPLKIVGAMQDITARKLNELSIKSLNDALNKRAKELADSNTELERFAYIASHDLQEPLRMVSSFLSLLEKKYQAQLDETASQYIRFAVDGADRMKRLIMDLLEYSRVGTNRDQLVETDMNEIVAQVLDTFAGKIQETNACIQTVSLPVIKANKTQILQLLQNLVGNAFKYNTSAQPVIKIGYKEQPGFWQFFVKDNGIGIDPRFFDKVFIIFQRLHNKNEFSGTGIGLAICKKIIEKHGGSIWIESEVDAGSTFYFTIKK